jgi:hypothetical protein
VLEEEPEVREHGAQERQDDADLKGHEVGVSVPFGCRIAVPP